MFYDSYTYFEFVTVNPTTNLDIEGVFLVIFVCLCLFNAVKMINNGVNGYWFN